MRPRQTGYGHTNVGNNLTITIIMRSIFRFSVAVMMLIPMMASAQKQSDPEGYLTYSLPSTTIMLEVEGVQETFYVGPYAQYAEKYLGIKVRQKNDTTIHLTQVRMRPLVEADQTKRYSLNVKSKRNGSSLLKLSNQGLIALADAQFDGPMEWRFPAPAQCGDGITSDLTSATAALFNNGGRTSSMQNVLVGRSAEQRAAEAAQMILKLRTQRMQIVTGDTDATFDGEAMGAAITEITRLEEEYMRLFTGYSEYKNLAMRFDVIPTADQADQTYVAFRLANADGLVPADYMRGMPVLLQIIPQEIAVPEDVAATPAEATAETTTTAKKASSALVLAYYRIPAVCTVKLISGSNLLLQTRMPIYQLGQESSVPMNVTFK